MKKFCYIAIASLVILSCQIEDDQTPTPEEAFIKYYGELTSYEAKDLEIVYEGGEPVSLVILGSKLTEDGDRDFFIQRTDLDGNLIDSISFGFNTIIDTDRNDISDFDLNEDGVFELVSNAENDIFIGDDIPGKLAITNEAILIVGSTSITASLPNRTISDWRQLIFGVIPLSSDLNSLERDSIRLLAIAAVREPGNENNTVLDLEGNDVIQLNRGGILIVGRKEFDRGGVTDYDSYLLKIQLGDDLLIDFEKEVGVAADNEDEEAIRVFEKSNGDLVMIGSTDSNSRLGENGGNNGRNAYFIELDPNGNPINRRYYGVDNEVNEADESVYNESVTNAMEVPSGYVIVGTSETSQNLSYGFAISLDHDGEHLSSASLPSNDFGGLQTSIMGVAQARDNDFVLVGQYPGFTLEGGKSGEALFMKVDESLNYIPGNESNFGLTDGNDEFVDAVTLPDGSIVVVGNIDFGAGAKLISIVKLNDTGNLED